MADDMRTPGRRSMSSIRRRYALPSDELEAVLGFLCVGLPRLRDAEPDVRTGRLLDALDTLVQLCVDHPALHTSAAEDRPSVRAKIRELVLAVARGPNLGPRTGVDKPMPPEARPSVAPEAHAGSPPRILSRVVGAERHELRAMLPAPLSERSTPFEVIQASLEHQKERVSARTPPSSRLSPARSEAVRSPPRRASSSAPLRTPSRAELRAHSPQPWSTAVAADRARSRSPMPFDGGGGEEDAAGMLTLVESCEAYLATLRAQQAKLREERRLAAERERPPVPGWYAMQSKDFTQQLRRAKSWADPDPLLDWWRDSAGPPAVGDRGGGHG
ncbi:hypothetical protein KFE25_009981 [Diacronema lutheri]|uniref:Uncharacterized protein n=1 Tax=Diacronema lutheri TaxID=2081491 RepID=A0A8J5XD95_DIALT|nr:hypothetical protein KFE25_009981 [Diacronema lutheri]